MSDFSGRHALITGGSGGIGAATAKQFLADGGSVSLLGRGMPALEGTAEALRKQFGSKVKIQLLPADALKADEIKQAMQSSYDFASRLDICVSTVGGIGQGSG